jgi:hypothetical protein
VSSSVFELFDEYAAAYARGERPSAEDYLNRAGTEREQLARLLDEFLRRAPIQPPSEDDTRLLGLMLAEEPPLLTLRVERRIRVDDVVSTLVERLGLDRGKRAKVKRYYQQLEGGLIDPSGLSKRLRTALTELFGGDTETALTWTARPAQAATAFMRLAEPLAAQPAAPAAEPGEEDEIDRLFTGGE